MSDLTNIQPDDLESLLGKVQSQDATIRRAAVEVLKNAPQSNERIVRALIKVRQADPDLGIAGVAAVALTLPTHRAILRSLPQQQNNTLSNAEPWDPNRIFGFIYIISVIGVGIALGLNWKRLGKPEWSQKTILLSVILPVASITLALAWIFNLIQSRNATFAVVMSIPFLALGINIGYVWALTRLQNGAYKKWKQESQEAMLAHQYNINEAIRFGVIVAVVTTLIGIFISPLFK